MVFRQALPKDGDLILSQLYLPLQTIGAPPDLLHSLSLLMPRTVKVKLILSDHLVYLSKCKGQHLVILVFRICVFLCKKPKDLPAGHAGTQALAQLLGNLVDDLVRVFARRSGLLLQLASQLRIILD